MSVLSESVPHDKFGICEALSFSPVVVDWPLEPTWPAFRLKLLLSGIDGPVIPFAKIRLLDIPLLLMLK
ncbi:hypothetical protein HMPREF2787_10790 [Corynebacterium sp. HMSC061H03]|nr:hypothetical protein HMPREF2820_00595 [Corynebacterium sp. HMSC064E08]OHR23907.1 hypothetical protein HMPREF2787_10790 [Corynebacterium sp. HMSC061H03]